MIALRDQAYYVPGLPKYLHIISPQGIRTSEGYKSTFTSHCHEEQDGYAELNLKEYKPGCQKAKPVERFYVKYEPKKNLSNTKANLLNLREKEVMELTSAICVTNEDNQILTPSQKELLLWHFRLGHIGFQHVQRLIRTVRLKVARKFQGSGQL